jgi:hypothetical protein
VPSVAVFSGENAVGTRNRCRPVGNETGSDRALQEKATGAMMKKMAGVILGAGNSCDV